MSSFRQITRSLRLAPITVQFVLGFYSFVVITTALDTVLVPSGQRALYLATRFLLVAPLLFTGWRIYRHPDHSRETWFFCLLALLIALQGEWFRTIYNLSLFLILAAMAAVMPLSRRGYWPLAGAAVVGHFLVLSGHDFLPSRPLGVDRLVSVLLSVGLASVLFWMRLTNDEFRRHASERFGLVGFHSTRIAHDMKGVLSAPTIYAGILKERLGGGGFGDSIIDEAVQGLSRDLEHARSVLTELGALTRWTGELVRSSQELEKITVSEALAETRALLQGSLSAIQVFIQGKSQFQEERSFLIAAFLNFFMSALESFKRSKPVLPSVWIELDRERVSFRDNGGGFSAEVLQQLSMSDGRTYALTGAGIGLVLLSEWAKSRGAEIRFSNARDGGKVELLLLPESRTRSAAGPS